MKKLAIAILSALITLTYGCAARVSNNWDRVMTEKPDIALSVPFVAQTDYFCGPASLSMALKYTHEYRTPEKLAAQVFTPSKKGSFQTDMLTGARRNGRIPYPVKTPDELISQLKQGRPSVVFLNLAFSWHPVWHYAVVTGIKQSQGYVIMHSGDTEYQKVDLNAFDHVWKRGEYWGFTLLKPGEVPEDADPLVFIDAVSAYELSDPYGAGESYEAAYKKWPGDKTVMFAWGNWLYAHVKKADAVDVYRRLTESYPDFADGWNNLSSALNDSSLKKDAVWAAEKAVKLGGKNLPVYEQTLKEAQTP